MLHLKPAKPTGFGPFSQEFFRPNWNSAPCIQNALILGLVRDHGTVARVGRVPFWVSRDTNVKNCTLKEFESPVEIVRR
jgi:hypothetical protein